MISVDPVRARDDPVVVKNIPYYKAKKTLEAEVMKLDPPPRPQNWGVRLNFLHFLAHFKITESIIKVLLFLFLLCIISSFSKSL